MIGILSINGEYYTCKPQDAYLVMEILHKNRIKYNYGSSSSYKDSIEHTRIPYENMTFTVSNFTIADEQPQEQVPETILEEGENDGNL
jgi:hypothetical protein